MIAVGGALELSAADDLDAVLSHQAAHPALVADMGEEHHVTPLPMRRGPMLPGMKAALSYPHKAAKMPAGQHAAIFGNILNLHGF